MNAMLQAPFPWFGGKSKVADIVWRRFGDVRNYLEPFFGSGAVLLCRPEGFRGPETVNDFDGFLANFWRSIVHDPEETAHWADWPVNEVDKHARHAWLIKQRETLTARLMGDPNFYDAMLAGWWVYGLCSWIGSGWCSGKGPWIVKDGMLVDSRKLENRAGNGITRQRPALSSAGMGINRQLPNMGGSGIHSNGRRDAIIATFQELSARLRHVRVCCGDWSRVMGESVTTHHAGITGVFLDPPYADTAKRDANLYACDSLTVAHDVREWAIANGDNPRLRIALCGYEGEHTMPKSWACVPWKANGGYSNRGATANENKFRERIWFSPACIDVERTEEVCA